LKSKTKTAPTLKKGKTLEVGPMNHVQKEKREKENKEKNLPLERER